MRGGFRARGAIGEADTIARAGEEPLRGNVACTLHHVPTGFRIANVCSRGLGKRV